MKELSMAVSAAAVAAAALSSLVPGTKYESHIKTVTALALAVNILALLQGFDMKELFVPEDKSLGTYSYDDYLKAEAGSELADKVRDTLKEYEAGIVSVGPEINIDDDEGIYLKKLRLVLKSGADSETISELLQREYGYELPLEVVISDE